MLAIASCEQHTPTQLTFLICHPLKELHEIIETIQHSNITHDLPYSPRYTIFPTTPLSLGGLTFRGFLLCMW
jgi:hypothetical protein